jgi:hypothetical protein
MPFGAGFFIARCGRTSILFELEMLFRFAICVSMLGFIGVAMSLMMDVFAPDWDIHVRARYPQFTTRNRLIAGAVCFALPAVLIFAPLQLEISLALLALSPPFVWLKLLARRKK